MVLKNNLRAFYNCSGIEASFWMLLTVLRKVKRLEEKVPISDFFLGGVGAKHIQILTRWTGCMYRATVCCVKLLRFEWMLVIDLKSDRCTGITKVFGPWRLQQEQTRRTFGSHPPPPPKWTRIAIQLPSRSQNINVTYYCMSWKKEYILITSCDRVTPWYPIYVCDIHIYAHVYNSHIL